MHVHAMPNIDAVIPIIGIIIITVFLPILWGKSNKKRKNHGEG